jgi:hypothetical protein
VSATGTGARSPPPSTADLDVEIGLPADRDLDLDLHRGQRAVGVTGQRHPSRGQVGPGVGDPDLRRIVRKAGGSGIAKFTI